MADRKVKVGVEIDGEKQYKEAIASMNEGNKVLASEMRKLKAEYQGNTESMEFLSKKGDILERQLLTQKDKVSQLREALERVAKEYGEADKRTQEWQIKLNDAEAAQFKLEHAIEENNEALQDQGEEMTGLGDTVDQLAGKFGVNLPKGAKEALNGMKGFSAGTVAAMAAAAAAIAAVIKTVSDLSKLTLEVAAQVDEYITESTITGVPTEMLQAWDYAASLIDVDANTIKGAMTKITMAMGDARDGSGKSAEAFQALGVSITDADGQLRSAEDVFYEVIDALSDVENQTERNILTNELMGKSAQDLNPLINQGSEALKGLAEEAEALGYILDEEQIKKLGEVDDAYQKLQLTIDAQKKQMAAELAPAVQSCMELFADVVKAAGEALVDSGILENLSLIIQNLVEIIRSATNIEEGLPGFTSMIEGLSVVLGGLAQFVAVIADAADLISGILNPSTWGSGQIKNALGLGYGSGNANHYQRTVMQQQGRLQQYDDFYAGRNAGGTDFWRGGMTWVGENGPELVSLPRGSQIMNSQESSNIVSGGTENYYFNIDVRDLSDLQALIMWAKTARVTTRMR